MVVIIVLVMGRGTYQPSTIVSTNGNSGWGAGPAWILSMSTGQYCFYGAGACTHMAEEMPRPSRKLPHVINLTMLIGVVTSVVWIIVILLVIEDVEAVQQSYLPNLEVLYQATKSKPVATFLQAYMTMLYYSKSALRSQTRKKLIPFSLRAITMDYLFPHHLGLFS